MARGCSGGRRWGCSAVVLRLQQWTASSPGASAQKQTEVSRDSVLVGIWSDKQYLSQHDPCVCKLRVIFHLYCF